MKRVIRFVAQNDSLVLVFCSSLFGAAWVLSNQSDPIPHPWWYTGSLERFSLFLLGWTALLHPDPIHRLIWSITDCIALSLPFFAGILFVPVDDVLSLLNYWTVLGKLSAGLVFGMAIVQGLYSLLPNYGRAARNDNECLLTQASQAR